MMVYNFEIAFEIIIALNMWQRSLNYNNIGRHLYDFQKAGGGGGAQILPDKN